MDKQTSFPSTQEKLEPCLQSEGEDENWVNVDCDAAPVEIAHDPLHNSIGNRNYEMSNRTFVESQRDNVIYLKNAVASHFEPTILAAEDQLVSALPSIQHQLASITNAIHSRHNTPFVLANTPGYTQPSRTADSKSHSMSTVTATSRERSTPRDDDDCGGASGNAGQNVRSHPHRPVFVSFSTETPSDVGDDSKDVDIIASPLQNSPQLRPTSLATPVTMPHDGENELNGIPTINTKVDGNGHGPDSGSSSSSSSASIKNQSVLRLLESMEQHLVEQMEDNPIFLQDWITNHQNSVLSHEDEDEDEEDQEDWNDEDDCVEGIAQDCENICDVDYDLKNVVDLGSGLGLGLDSPQGLDSSEHSKQISESQDQTSMAITNTTTNTNTNTANLDAVIDNNNESDNTTGSLGQEHGDSNPDSKPKSTSTSTSGSASVSLTSSSAAAAVVASPSSASDRFRQSSRSEPINAVFGQGYVDIAEIWTELCELRTNLLTKFVNENKNTTQSVPSYLAMDASTFCYMLSYLSFSDLSRIACTSPYFAYCTLFVRLSNLYQRCLIHGDLDMEEIEILSMEEYLSSQELLHDSQSDVSLGDFLTEPVDHHDSHGKKLSPSSSSSFSSSSSSSKLSKSSTSRKKLPRPFVSKHLRLGDNVVLAEQYGSIFDDDFDNFEDIPSLNYSTDLSTKNKEKLKLKENENENEKSRLGLQVSQFSQKQLQMSVDSSVISSVDVNCSDCPQPTVVKGSQSQSQSQSQSNVMVGISTSLPASSEVKIDVTSTVVSDVGIVSTSLSSFKSSGSATSTITASTSASITPYEPTLEPDFPSSLSSSSLSSSSSSLVLFDDTSVNGDIDDCDVDDCVVDDNNHNNNDNDNDNDDDDDDNGHSSVGDDDNDQQIEQTTLEKKSSYNYVDVLSPKALISSVSAGVGSMARSGYESACQYYRGVPSVNLPSGGVLGNVLMYSSAIMQYSEYKKRRDYQEKLRHFAALHRSQSFENSVLAGESFDSTHQDTGLCLFNPSRVVVATPESQSQSGQMESQLNIVSGAGSGSGTRTDTKTISPPTSDCSPFAAVVRETMRPGYPTRRGFFWYNILCTRSTEKVLSILRLHTANAQQKDDDDDTSTIDRDAVLSASTHLTTNVSDQLEYSLGLFLEPILEKYPEDKEIELGGNENSTVSRNLSNPGSGTIVDNDNESHDTQDITPAFKTPACTIPLLPVHDLSPDVAWSIEKDVARTLLHAIGFRSISFADTALRKILLTYAALDPVVGYCQAMNFVAGFFLNECASSTALACFYNLLQPAVYPLTTSSPSPSSPAPKTTNDTSLWSYRQFVKPTLEEGTPEAAACRKTSLRLFFTSDLEGMQVSRLVFHKLLHTYLPKLAKHLEDHCLSVDFFMDWFMTLFASPTIPIATARYIWDCAFVEGVKSMYIAPLTVLYLAQDQLLEADFENMYLLLKKTPELDFFDIDIFPVVMSKYSRLVSNLQIQHLQRSAGTYLANHRQKDLESQETSNRRSRSKSATYRPKKTPIDLNGFLATEFLPE